MKLISIFLMIIPSYKFLLGLVGSTPFGILLAPFYFQKIEKKYLYLALFIFIILFSRISNFTELFNSALLYCPWVILMFFSLKFGFSRNFKKFIIIVIWIFFIEAIFGKFMSSEARSITFITQEPSHSARVFFLLLYLMTVSESGKNIKYISVATLYIFFNQSFTALLMFLPLVFINMRFLTVILSIFILSFSLNILPDRVHSQIYNVVGGLKKLNEANSQVIAILASRRAAQAVGSYYLSEPLTGVGSGNASSYLVEEASGTWIDFTYLVRENESLDSNSRIGASAYLAQVSYEHGYIFALMQVYILIFIFRPRWKIYDLTWHAIAVIQLLFFSSTLMPTAWVIIGVNHMLWRGEVRKKSL